MRCILAILDGLGDRGQETFQGKTPLHAAYTPNLDRIASAGMNGLYHSSEQGVPMPSETAHFLIFGYNREEFPGRGAIEAIGEGKRISVKDVAVLCHLCSVEQKGPHLLMKYGCPEMDEDEALRLKDSISTFSHNGIRCRLLHSKGIHGFLVLSGPVSEQITDSDPIYEGRMITKVLPVSTKRVSARSQSTAEMMNKYLKWCNERLSGHEINKKRADEGLLPVNALVTQRAGKRKKLMPFRKKWGLRGLSISSGPIYWGLCSELGMDVLKVKDTGNIEKDMADRLSLAHQAREYDFVHVHTKMPDEAGHTKNPGYKREVIESIDRAFSYAVHQIVPDRESLLVVSADHSTASSGIMIHTGETVPLCMAGRYVRKDKVEEFNEISCARGGLGIVKGKEMMYLILNFLDRAKLDGLMDTPLDQPYYPGDSEPLSL